MSETYNAVFLTNTDGTGVSYADTNSVAPAPPPPPEPIPSDFEVDQTATLTTGTPSVTLPLTRITGTGAFLAYSSDTNVVTCSISGNNLILIGVATGSATITVTMDADGDYLECTKYVEVTCSIVELVSFANGTDAQIAAMVAAADRGEIDLYEDGGWRVGDERQTTLSAISTSGTFDGISWSVGENQSGQTATLVLMHRGLYTLVDPVLNKDGSSRSTCSFVVGLKNSLATRGYMNSTDTNIGSWDSSARRGWCNGGFRQAVNSTLRAAFKKFNVITGTWSSGQQTGGANQSTQDYFCLAAEKEIFGTRSSCTTNEFDALTQFTWYETTANRIKKVGDSGSANYWWVRSPRWDLSSGFIRISSSGGSSIAVASNNCGLSPFGCI